MKRGSFKYLSLLVILMSCVQTPQKSSSGSTKSVSINLDFQHCGEELNYRAIEVELSRNYKLEKVVDDYGFCEYQLRYDDGSVFYVSSNIYSGSRMNYDNRLQIGVDTYSVNRTKNDTIVNGGKQDDELLWKEVIVGTYVVGYLNTDNPEAFELAIQGIKLRD